MRAPLTIALCLCALAALGAGCESEVAAGLSESDAQEAMALLADRGIASTRKGQGDGKSRRYALMVPAKQAGEAAQALRAAGLPRTPERGLAGLYAQGSMIPSATEEHARFLAALSSEIAGQLERFEAVIDASVIVTSPRPDPLAPADAAGRASATASVLLTLRAGVTPPPAEEVARLVAGAVEGLSPAAVTVVTETRAAAPERGGTLTSSLLGIHVARGSKGALVGLLAGALLLVAAMGAWVIFNSRRRAA